MNLNATLFVQCIVFLVFSLFTMRFVWPPVMKALDERAKKIADGLEFSQKAEKELVEVRQKAEDILESAQREAQDIVNQTAHKAQKLLDDARAQSTQLLSQAKKEVEQTKQLAIEQAREEMRIESLRIACLLAQKVLEKEVDFSVHQSFLKRVIKEM